MKTTLLLSIFLAVAVVNASTEVAARPNRPNRKTAKAHKTRVVQRTDRAPVSTLSPVPPEPVRPQPQIAGFLEQVADHTPRRLSDDYHNNPCELFDDAIAVVEAGRVICRNAIYSLESDMTQACWVETDRLSDKVERQTMIDAPEHGSVITTHTLAGTTEERGLYLARAMQ